jgi:hypothetical protein
MLPFVTILRLAALHIESGVVWCRNGMSDIRKRKKEIIIWKKKEEKEKEKRSNQKIKTSIRLSFFFSLATPPRLVVMDTRSHQCRGSSIEW